MKKVFLLAFALSIGGLVTGPELASADVQIDRGQLRSTAAKKFFVARYARTGAVATAGGFEISKDSVVVWDSTSSDGVTIQTTTSGGDALVAGITLDLIPGSSRDNTAIEDDNHDNWGRVQTWGLHEDSRSTSDATSAGTVMCSSATAQQVSPCDAVSGDVVGVALGSVSSNTVDLMVYRD